MIQPRNWSTRRWPALRPPSTARHPLACWRSWQLFLVRMLMHWWVSWGHCCPTRLGRVNLERALRWLHSLAKQLILCCWDFLLRSLVIFIFRDRPVLDFLLCVQSCRKVDWWRIPGARFCGGQSSNGRPRTSGISGLVPPSGTSDWSPGSSVWSPGMPDWNPGSSRRSLIMSGRRCLINGPGLGIRNCHTRVHPSLHESPHWHKVN